MVMIFLVNSSCLFFLSLPPHIVTAGIVHITESQMMVSPLCQSVTNLVILVGLFVG